MKIKKWEWAAIVVFAGVIGWRLCLMVIYGLPYFDGGMNIQVPVSMMRTGTYGTLYNGGTAFDIAVQTGLPVLFPIYVLFQIFGIGFVQALTVNAIYMVCMLLLLDRIGRHAGMEAEWRLMGIMLIFCMRNVYDYSLGVYGEVPSLVWLLVSVLCLMIYEEQQKDRWMYGAGVAYGLALLTKTVLFIAVPAIVIVLLSKIFLEKKLRIRDALKAVAGCVIPYSLFMGYKFLTLGTAAFQTLTRTLMKGIMKQAGVSSGYADTTGGIFHKFGIHMGILSGFVDLPVVLVFLILAVNLLYMGYNIIRRKHLVYFEILALTAYSYFGWWLLITSTEKAWFRRIFIGLLLMIFTMFWNLSQSVQVRKLTEKYRAFLPVLLCVILTGACTRQMQGILGSDHGKEKQAIAADAVFIRELKTEQPDAVFCGNGWWQAPLLSFASGIDFYDLNQTYVDNMYYVKDKYETEQGGDTMSELVKTFDLEEIYSNPDSKTQIYQVTGRHYYVPFTENEKNNAGSSIAKEAIREETAVRGLNPLEADSGNCWAERESAFLLKDTKATQVLLEGKVVNLAQMDVQPVTFSVYVNGDLAQTVTAATEGDFSLKIDVPEMNGADDACVEVRVSCSSHLVTDGDSRDLSWLFEKISLK